MNRIREWRKRRDWTLEQLAAAIGTSNQQVSRLEKGDRRLTVDWLVKLSRALEVEVDDLLSPEDLRRGGATVQPHPATGAGERIPVRGAARGGVEQEMYLDDPIDWVQRPTTLRDVRDAYAIYVVGDSMAPRYRAGTLLFVNPFKPPRRENGVVVQLRDRVVLVKEFVGWTGMTLLLSQFNPPAELTIERTDVLAVHTVVGTQEA